MLESIVNMMARINKNAEEQHGSNNLLCDNVHCSPWWRRSTLPVSLKLVNVLAKHIARP